MHRVDPVFEVRGWKGRTWRERRTQLVILMLAILPRPLIITVPGTEGGRRTASSSSFRSSCQSRLS